MSSIRGILSYTLLLTLLGTSISTELSNEAQVDHDAFQKLLAQVDSPALHAALHDFSPKKFKHGMFPEDRTAVEAIHKEEPGIATGILKMAKLAKRADNGTVTTTQVAPKPTTTLNLPAPIGPQTSTVESPAINPSTTVPVTTSAAPATTSAPSTLATSTSASYSSGQVVTTTNAQGQVIVTTIGGGAVTLSPSSTSKEGLKPISITSTLLQTSTLPNGEQSTITAVTVIGVGGDEATRTAGAGPAGTSGGSPGLQTGEAVMTRGCGREMAVVLGAAVGVAFML